MRIGTIVYRRHYEGDKFYLGHWNRKYYIRYCRMFQVAIYGAILSFSKIKKTNFIHWSNARVFYWVVPHYTGATHSIGIYWLEITLVFQFNRIKD